MVGNINNYDDVDVFRVFIKINGKKPRKELSEELLLGEGSVKGILNLLKKKDLLKSTKRGHFLSEAGKDLREKISVEISEMKNVNLSVFKGFNGVALVIRNSNKTVTHKERDIAIRTGAEAALLFKFRKKLFLPQCEQDVIDTSKLDPLFDYSNGDVLAVVFGKDKRIIENALLNVGLGLSTKLGGLFREMIK